jgi:hypothetical protein
VRATQPLSCVGPRRDRASGGVKPEPDDLPVAPLVFETPSAMAAMMATPSPRGTHTTTLKVSLRCLRFAINATVPKDEGPAD